MNIVSLTSNQTFSDSIKQALHGDKGKYLFEMFGLFAKRVETKTPDFVIVDAKYLRNAPSDDVWDYMEYNAIPMLIVDDMVGELSDKIEPGRYPNNTSGVIFNEVLTQPAILKQVLQHMRDTVSQADENDYVPDAQEGIHKILGQYDWGMDPDFAHQYNLEAA